ncbi:MAG: adenylyltransferase/cytidyltransferase family protein, partial [Lachnospiraceae bacterium]|nr:adenylyltransferase/cytidyltransferase family protein [Lachnospiraceae bacterium]
MMKIGIMGGTFNPVHNAHIKLALSAYEELNLDKVLFMPSKKPPHKDNNVILSDEVRSDMIKLAIKPYNFFEFSDFELIRNTTTYTSETLELLDINDDNTYYFIMG